MGYSDKAPAYSRKSFNRSSSIARLYSAKKPPPLGIKQDQYDTLALPIQEAKEGTDACDAGPF